jgi:hypothetical protein
VLVFYAATSSGEFRYGLAVRRSGEQYYAFTISPRSKTFYILKHSASQTSVLRQGTDATINGLRPGARDNLRVDAKGSEFAFFINGRSVAQVSDPEYTKGDVGFFVAALDETLAHVHYDSLTISKLSTP